MTLTQRYDEALVFASELHRQQMRKGTDIPYLSHLLAVSSLVMEHGGDEDQAIAGLLHDAVEDQGGAKTLAEIERRFGHDVGQIVADCTDAWTDPKPPWRARKEQYLAALPKKPQRSLLVSLADKTHNARAIRMDLCRLGDAFWSRFSGGKDGTLWYYSSLAQIFAKVLPGDLGRELEDTVVSLERA
jgi:(p)ppGpp synthase/HD superfamily hydrolase